MKSKKTIATKNVRATTGTKVRTNVKAEPIRDGQNHNQTVISGSRVKSNAKAGGIAYNHNQTLMLDTKSNR
ncbi:MAG TPA: hypothetical protein VF131_07050 [Blastocatellia bacterium]|nr:hypothetical protein [Blastocatellia bacterium]